MTDAQGNKVVQLVADQYRTNAALGLQKVYDANQKELGIYLPEQEKTDVPDADTLKALRQKFLYTNNDLKVAKVLTSEMKPGISPVVVEYGEIIDNKCKDCICSKVYWSKKVGCEFVEKVLEICSELWPEHDKFEKANELMSCMAVETNQMFMTTKEYLEPFTDAKGKTLHRNAVYTKEQVVANPDIASRPGAVGLIQFVPASIEQLNSTYSLQLDKYKVAIMTPLEQLDLVEKHFKFWIKQKAKENLKIRNLADMYCTIFCPKLVGKDDDAVGYVGGTSAYQSNKSLDTDGDSDGKIQFREVRQRVQLYFPLGMINKMDDSECRKGRYILLKKLQAGMIQLIIRNILYTIRKIKKCLIMALLAL